MRTVIRFSTVTIAAAALAISTAGAASAESTTLKDRSDDVVGDGGPRGTAQQKAFSRGLDVKNIKLSQGSANASLTIRFFHLKRNNFAEVAVAFQVPGAARKSNSALYAIVGKTDPKAYSTDTDSGGGTLCANDDPALPDIKTAVKYGKNGYFRITVPRGCVESIGAVGTDASWLRARVEVDGSLPTGVRNEEGTQGFDYVSRTRTNNSSWTKFVRTR